MPYSISLDQFEHLLALVIVAIHTWQHQLEPLFNPIVPLFNLIAIYSWSFCISASFALMACFNGELQSLVLAWCVHVSTRGRDSTQLQGGETHKRGEIPNLPHIACMHSSGRLHLFRGRCIWVASARCVEPVPFVEGLAVFWLFEFC
jgi:hypothetical protein